MYYLVHRHTEYIIDIWLYKYINSDGVKVSIIRDPDKAKPITDEALVKLVLDGAADNQLCVSFMSWKDRTLQEYPWKNYPIEDILKKAIRPRRRRKKTPPPTEE